MSDAYVGEIRMFAGNFAPVGWANCEGQLLSVSQNDALFSLLGTQYGGDGETTFGLPDLRGRVPIHFGSGPGLTFRQIGQKIGAENVILTSANLPTHTHDGVATSAVAYSNDPTGAVAVADRPAYAAGATVDMAASENSGASVGHSNRQPYLGVRFIICLTGYYPSES